MKIITIYYFISEEINCTMPICTAYLMYGGGIGANLYSYLACLHQFIILSKN